MYIRQEYKYLVSNELLDDIRAMLLPYVRLDSYLSKSDSVDYTVRSIYFDTCRLSLYQEKISGLKLRKKFRLRGYDRPVEGYNVSHPYRISPLSDTYMMKPGEAYWIHVPADTVWVVDW